MRNPRCIRAKVPHRSLPHAVAVIRCSKFQRHSFWRYRRWRARGPFGSIVLRSRRVRGAGRIVDESDLARGIRKASNYLIGAPAFGGDPERLSCEPSVRYCQWRRLDRHESATKFSLLAWYRLKRRLSDLRNCRRARSDGPFDVEMQPDEHLEHARLIREEKAQKRKLRSATILSPLQVVWWCVARLPQDPPRLTRVSPRPRRSDEEPGRRRGSYIENLSPSKRFWMTEKPCEALVSLEKTVRP